MARPVSAGDDVLMLRAAAASSLTAFRKRAGAIVRPGGPPPAEWIPRDVPRNRGAVRLSYALVSCYRDIKGLVAGPDGFDLRRFGLEASPFLNRSALNGEAVGLVRRVLAGYLMDQAAARDALLAHLARVRRDRLLGPATPGKLAFIKAATGQAFHELSPEATDRHLVALRQQLLDLLGRQVARLRRNGRPDNAVVAMIGRVRAETAPTALAGEGVADYPAFAEAIKASYLGNARRPRPGDPRFPDDIAHFCHVYADEIAAILRRHTGGPAGGISVDYAPRDAAFAVLGDVFGDCSARRAKAQVDPKVANIHWTTYSWALYPFYRVVVVRFDGDPAVKGHVLPLLLDGQPVLALDAVEVVPPLREEVRGRPNPYRSERLLDVRYNLLDALLGAALDIGHRAGAEAVMVDKFSNCSWVRRAVDELPAHAYHVRDAVLPFGMEPIRALSLDLLGPGHDSDDLAMEVQARNLGLMDQGLREGWKEVGILDGDLDKGMIPIRGP